jgi:hypothetical protein
MVEYESLNVTYTRLDERYGAENIVHNFMYNIYINLESITQNKKNLTWHSVDFFCIFAFYNLKDIT